MGAESSQQAAPTLHGSWESDAGGRRQERRESSGPSARRAATEEERNEMLAEFVAATGWTCEEGTALLASHDWQLPPALAEVLGADAGVPGAHQEVAPSRGLAGYGGYGGYRDAYAHEGVIGSGSSAAVAGRGSNPSSASDQFDRDLAAALAASRGFGNSQNSQATDRELAAAIAASTRNLPPSRSYDQDLAAAIAASRSEQDKALQRHIEEEQEQIKALCAQSQRGQQQQQVDPAEHEDLKARLRALEVLVEQQQLQLQAAGARAGSAEPQGTASRSVRRGDGDGNGEREHLNSRLRALEESVVTMGQQRQRQHLVTSQAAGSGVAAPSDDAAESGEPARAGSGATTPGGAGQAEAPGPQAPLPNTAAAVLARARGGPLAAKKKRVIKDGRITFVDE